MKTSTLFLLTLTLISRTAFVVADDRYAGEPFQWGTVSGGVLGAPAIGPVTWNAVVRMESATRGRDIRMETELDVNSETFSLQTSQLSFGFGFPNDWLFPTTTPNVWQSTPTNSFGLERGSLDIDYEAELGYRGESVLHTFLQQSIPDGDFVIEIDFSQYPEKQLVKLIPKSPPLSVTVSASPIDLAPVISWSTMTA